VIVAVVIGWVLPGVMVITRLVMLLIVTLIVAVPLTPWAVAVMLAEPRATPVTEPPGEVTLAMVGAELDQPTESPLS
jgi:hypothetical protein